MVTTTTGRIVSGAGMLDASGEVKLKPKAMWLPGSAKKVGVDRAEKVLIGILGKSGAGKSHLVYQLARDPGYGPDEVLVLMAEDATATYAAQVNVSPVHNLNDVNAVVTELIAASARGERLPKVIVWDSLSGTLDYQRAYYKAHPMEVWSKEQSKMVKDVRAQFGDMGYSGMDEMVRLRDSVSSDIIVLATTYESFGQVEFAIEGKLLPKNFVRLTSVCLHLQVAEFKVDPGLTQVKPAPHRTLSFNEKGEFDGTYLDRHFVTMDNGEFSAKGHHALNLREKAYLPRILRRIHGKPEPAGT